MLGNLFHTSPKTVFASVFVFAGSRFGLLRRLLAPQTPSIARQELEHFLLGRDRAVDLRALRATAKGVRWAALL